MSDCIMLMGCTSDAGKSFLATLLCRHFAGQGIRVAPFKSQNMSNNAAVTESGGEIGRAQFVQAKAARQLPVTDFNPVLLKPQGNRTSQVILHGRADHVLNARQWHQRRELLWPEITATIDRLRAQYELLVIEGAGSPAEVNLRRSDIVNFEVALYCQADVFLVVDIDRGGAYAHLLGTYECLSPEEQQRVKGFVLNKFRGDETLLQDANDWILARTGVPVVAVFHFQENRIPEEDNFFHRRSQSSDRAACRAGLIVYPYASNMDEFDPLAYDPDIELVPLLQGEMPDDLDAILLPGSKHVAASMQYLRDQGMDLWLQQQQQKGVLVMGICGGMQLLGERVEDEAGLEGGSFEGLGLLPLLTHFEAAKQTTQRCLKFAGTELKAYEIHMGRSQALSGKAGMATFIEPGTGFCADRTYATYLHGLFENRAFMAWFKQQLGCPDSGSVDWAGVVDQETDRLCQFYRPALEAMLSYSGLKQKG